MFFVTGSLCDRLMKQQFPERNPSERGAVVKIPQVSRDDGDREIISFGSLTTMLPTSRGFLRLVVKLPHHYERKVAKSLRQ